MMLRSSAHMRSVYCQTCRDQGLPDRNKPGEWGNVPTYGDWMTACHDAVDHVDQTGHEPVVVLETNTATYGKRERGSAARQRMIEWT